MKFVDIKQVISDVGGFLGVKSVAKMVFWLYDEECTKYGAVKDDKFFMYEGSVAPYEEFMQEWNSRMRVLKTDNDDRASRNIHFILVALYASLFFGNGNNDVSGVERAHDETDEAIIKEIYNVINGGEEDKDDDYIDDEEEEYEEEEEESSDEESEDERMLLEEFVNPTVNEIMSVYEAMIAPCFQKKPYGILAPVGVWRYEKGELIEKQSVYAKRLYAMINMKSNRGIRIGEGNKVSSSMITADGKMIKNYVPKFQAQIAYGLMSTENGGYKKENNWNNYKEKLRGLLIDMIMRVVKQADEDNIIEVQGAIKELFTNVFIVDKLDRAKELRIRYKFDNLQGSDRLGVNIRDNSKQLFGIGEGVGELIADEVESGNIHSVLYVFDKKLFAGDILFAYRAFEEKIRAGGKVNEMQVLIGMKMSGKDEVVNMGSPQNVSTVLMAGSGSGKGVLTLNILATLIASGCPFAYLDFKPDMAGAMWDFERQSGARILAIDSLANRTGGGSEPVRKYAYGMNAPAGVPLETNQYAIVPYLKLMQLSALIAGYRANGKMNKNKKMFFILDEAQGCNGVYTKMLENLTAYIKRFKKGEEDKGLEYARHMLEAYGDKLTGDIENVINTTGRVGLVGYFTIGQDCDPDNWKDGIHPWGKSLFGVLVGKCSTKFIGKNGGKSPTYSAVGMKDGGSLSYVTGKGDEEGKLGYFVTAHGAVCKDATASVFKSYLVLNDADYEKDPVNGYAASMLKNITDTVIRDKIINEDFYNNGKLNDRVGFMGLMNYLASNMQGIDIKKSMASGYELVWEAMNMCGLAQRYSCIEEYLFDCSRDSIFTLSELKDGVKKVNDGGNGKAGDEESFEDDESFEDEESFGDDESSDINDDDINDDTWGDPEPIGDTPNERESTGNIYAEELPIEDNPYILGGENPGPVDMMNALSSMSGVLIKCIRDIFGSLDRVKTFKVTRSEVLIVNDIAVRPRLPEEVIKSLPFDIKGRAIKGCYAEMFKFSDLRKFTNLSVLEIEDVNYAETRVKVELGLNNRKGWNALFSRFKNLRDVIIGGTSVRDEAKYERSDQYQSYKLTDRLREHFHMPTISTSGIGRMYKSKRVPTIVKVAGTIAGVGGMFWVASMLGIFALPVGLLFGNKVMKK